MMTEDEARQIGEAVAVPVREVFERVVALVEQLAARVEVLELERLAERPAPERDRP